MKKIFLLGIFAGILACPSTTKAHDDSSTSPPPPPPPPHGGPMVGLTPDEKAELLKARQDAFAADPDLKTEQDALRASHQPGTPPTPDDLSKMKAFHEELNAEMVKVDPEVAPILAKIKAHHHGPGGPPPTADSGPSDPAAFGTTDPGSQ